MNLIYSFFYLLSKNIYEFKKIITKLKNTIFLTIYGVARDSVVKVNIEIHKTAYF